jgi:FtsH-binding integral membrane protein
MAGEIYPLIFVLLMIAAIAIDTWKLTEKDHGSGSELHAADRYAVAERILQ